MRAPGPKNRGYALPNADDPDRTDGGAKPTHLAVPAGAVYYFQCESPEAAQALFRLFCVLLTSRLAKTF